MARASVDAYGPEGSVPNPVQVSGSGAQPLSTRASPEDFGAQVGAAYKGATNEVFWRGLKRLRDCPRWEQCAEDLLQLYDFLV